MTYQAATRVVFSAQFGGRDAAELVLPHFRALQQAAGELRLHKFPFETLAYVLRVDGEVSRFGISGPGCVDKDQSGSCLSVDIGIELGSRKHLREFIQNALTESVELIRDALPSECDGEEVADVVNFLCVQYGKKDLK